MNPGAATGVCRIDGRWRGLAGTAFGLQQPVLVGQAAVGGLGEDDWARLEALARRMPGIRLQAVDPQADLAHRFVFRLLDWIGAVQRHVKVPVAESVYLREMPAPAGPTGLRAFRLALAAPLHVAAQATIEWVIAHLPHVLGARSLQEGLPDLNAISTTLERYAAPGVNNFHIRQAAQRLGIPVLQESPTWAVFGCGAQSRLMNSTLTDRTPAVGVGIASSKLQTATLLRGAGLPGTLHQRVNSADEAVAAAKRLGYPVVVKPDDQERGVGVMANLVQPEQVRQAYAAAGAISRRVLVERWVDGLTHRLTVFRGRVIRAVRRIPGGVTGDGTHSIEALLALQQQREREQALGGLQAERAVTLDAEAIELLAQDGQTPQHVPAAGTFVRLRRRDNINAGGRNQELVLSDLHPDNLRLAVDAASTLGLDFAGIDLISRDISRSWIDNGAAICEVNAKPQMGVGGDPRIYESVLRELMGDSPCIAIHVLLAPAAAATRAEVVAGCLRESPEASLSDVSGLWIGGRRVSRPFGSGFDAAMALLLRRDVHRAVCVMSVDEVASSGFPVSSLERVDVARTDGLSPQERRLLKPVLEMLPIAVSAGPAMARLQQDARAPLPPTQP